MRNGIGFSSLCSVLKKTRARQPPQQIRFITKTNREYMLIARVFSHSRQFGFFHFVFQLAPCVISLRSNQSDS